MPTGIKGRPPERRAQNETLALLQTAPLTVSEIAHRLKLGPRYVEQIISKLHKDGLIQRRSVWEPTDAARN